MANLDDKIIAFVYMATYQSFVRKNVLYTDAVLDIGSGSGFLKPLVERQGGSISVSNQDRRSIKWRLSFMVKMDSRIPYFRKI
jgi:hypothetical protein